MKRLQSGESLVGVIVAMAVVAFAVVFFVTGGFGLMGGGEVKEREDKLGKTLVGRARYAAEDSKCKTQLSQVRQLLGLATDQVDGTRPASLAEVPGMPHDYHRCPIDKQEYDYDPATGEVTCPHEGHEEY